MALAVRLPMLRAGGITLDESFSLRTCAQPLPETLHRALNFELQPPVYFLALNLWLKVQNSLQFARLLSLLISLGSIFVAYRIGMLLAGSAVALWVALICGLAPWEVFFAGYARCYALASFLSISNIYFFTRLTLKEAKPAFKGGYAITAAAALLTYYYCAWVLVAEFLVALILLLRGKKEIFSFIKLQAFLALLLILWATVAARQAAMHPSYPPLEAKQLRFGVLSAIHHAYLGGNFAILNFSTDKPLWKAERHLREFSIGALLLTFAVSVWQRRLRRDDLRWIFAVLSLVPACILGTLYLTGFSLVDGRHFVTVVIPAFMLLCFSLAEIPYRALRLAGIGLFLLIEIISLRNVYAKAHEGDWDQVVTRVAAQLDQSDAIVFFQSEQQVPFDYLFRGTNRRYGIPEDFDFAGYDIEKMKIFGEEQLRDRFLQIFQRHPRAWLIKIRSTVIYNRPIGAEILNRYVEENLKESCSETLSDHTISLLEPATGGDISERGKP